ncbi:uncharacterized protein CC84DRAFT_1250933 [Paraphaeosphaeria sporulosa]|uniref:Protein kinase domain-containing protein n=1 Tax=Paraphaeosphaeria sporulosa TaxID=1460663 RepID=A0A177C7X0_9PLEO|nr:uncharacterized protein CC84DRAFT_1250933 [Paraphaeosphaeria sporulosa]OAG02949.1 hypothetical protein CC84DRAFT_1250933 [Paraphaeosphaeria sporulosa]
MNQAPGISTGNYHALIFELATYSLEDFLEDEKCYQRFVDKSLVLTRLADIEEALYCLHVNPRFLHLDIKPGNILGFVEPEPVPSSSNRENGRELIWKLSDFSLAREKDNTRERTGRRVFSSLSSSHPSKLPGRDLPKQIHKYDCEYLENFSPSTGTIPATNSKLEAAVHPDLIKWPNALYESRIHDSKQPLVKEILEIIFRRVLLVTRKERITTVDLHKLLKLIPKRWEAELDIHSGEDNQQQATLQRQLPPKAKRMTITARIRLHVHCTIPLYSTSSPHSHPIPFRSLRKKVYHLANLQLSALCDALKHDRAHDVQKELNKDPELVGKACTNPNCQMRPIHVALRNLSPGKANAFDVVLKHADPGVTSARCFHSGNHTALERTGRHLISAKTSTIVVRRMWDVNPGSCSSSYTRNPIGGLNKRIHSPDDRIH